MFIKEDVIWKKCQAGSMLYNARTEEKMILNDSATNLFLSTYVNHFEISDIAENLKSKFSNMEYDDILEDVASCIREIDNSNFVTINPQKMNFINLLDSKYSLDNVIFEITGRCNLSCVHCIEGGSKVYNELSLEEICKIIDELQMLGVYRVVLTGGEPFARKDIMEIIEKFSSKAMKVIIFTNGALINNEMLDKLAGNNILLRFSLDGATAETHDFIRGGGSFEKTIRIIDKCREKGIEIGIASTIYSKNFDEYKDIVKLAGNLNVRELELSEIVPFGNAKEYRDLLLSRKQLEQLRVYNLELGNSNESFARGTGLAKQAEQRKRDAVREYSCNAGISTCFIGCNGDVYPCTLFKEFDEFCIGNAGIESLFEIWNYGTGLDKFRNLKVSYLKKCKSCDCFNLCPGGCRAKAYIASNNLLGDMEDEYCQISNSMRKRMINGEFNYIWEKISS